MNTISISALRPGRRAPRPAACNALLVYPRFNPNSFWNYQATCDVVGAKYPAAPLGLITVAALLTSTWNLKFVNCNTEPLEERDLQWADVVLTGGMLPQQRDELRVIAAAHAAGIVHRGQTEAGESSSTADGKNGRCAQRRYDSPSARSHFPSPPSSKASPQLSQSRGL